MMARLPYYAKGTRVRYKGREATISHVLISKSILYVCLNDIEGPVQEHEIEIEPVMVRLVRQQIVY